MLSRIEIDKESSGDGLILVPSDLQKVVVSSLEVFPFKNQTMRSIAKWQEELAIAERRAERDSRSWRHLSFSERGEIMQSCGDNIATARKEIHALMLEGYTQKDGLPLKLAPSDSYRNKGLCVTNMGLAFKDSEMELLAHQLQCLINYEAEADGYRVRWQEGMQDAERIAMLKHAMISGNNCRSEVVQILSGGRIRG